jgi:hypothetical protein
MKVKVTVAERPAFGRLVHRIREVVLSAARTDRLAHELEAEAEAVSASERTADPEARRDALERAVRRVWGATL